VSEDHGEGKTLTLADFKKQRAMREKGGKESDFVGHPGHWRKYKKSPATGTDYGRNGKQYYEWGVTVDHGSKGAREIGEAMQPLWREETQKRLEEAAQGPKVERRVASGATFFLGELNQAEFCPTCGYRWAWCEGHE